MKLTDDEKRMLAGDFGPHKAKALNFVVQFGEAFDAERLVDIIYVHYPAEMAIYRGMVEDAVDYAATGASVCVPTTSSTLACDLDNWSRLGCPKAVFDLQEQIVSAHRKMGVLATFTCTPQFCGFVPPRGSYIVSVESSAIVYFNSVLGARTNRGGFLTRYSAVCGKYPLMGYLLDKNRKGTHLFRVKLSEDDLKYSSDYSALGFHVGGIVGSEVPVLDYLGIPTQQSLLALGAALATSGSVSLFHAPPHTTEAKTVEEAFQGCEPPQIFEITAADLRAVYEKLTNIHNGSDIDFVTLGCPHYNLEELRYVANWFSATKARVHPDVRLWVCTNRMTRQAAKWEGITQRIEEAGGFIVADSCPVESHMRISTCKEHGIKTPQVEAMVTDSAKMARYVGDLIGCRTALTCRDACLRCATTGKYIAGGE